MKKLSLRPYHGQIWLFDDYAEMQRVYARRTKTKWPYETTSGGGRYVRLESPTMGDVVWLVHAADIPSLSHELAHVLLHTFGTIGHNPTEGDGEPFCYMLSQLLIEAGA